MSSISRLISSASTSSSSSFSLPRSNSEVFQAASPVDHRFRSAFEGDSLMVCVDRAGEREELNNAESDGPSFSAGGDGSRFRP
jgi:hypothetical protein